MKNKKHCETLWITWYDFWRRAQFGICPNVKFYVDLTTLQIDKIL
jgi:hypothetical protein